MDRGVNSGRSVAKRLRRDWLFAVLRTRRFTNVLSQGRSAVITGNVSDDGMPVITLEVEGQNWSAIIDTGFNGDLELPEALRGKLNDQPAGRLRSALAAGRIVEEDAYSVEFPFDGQTCHAIATFVRDPQILI